VMPFRAWPDQCGSAATSRRVAIPSRASLSCPFDVALLPRVAGTYRWTHR
jgi:hypothetical protein